MKALPIGVIKRFIAPGKMLQNLPRLENPHFAEKIIQLRRARELHGLMIPQKRGRIGKKTSEKEKSSQSRAIFLFDSDQIGIDRLPAMTEQDVDVVSIFLDQFGIDLLRGGGIDVFADVDGDREGVFIDHLIQ